MKTLPNFPQLEDLINAEILKGGWPRLFLACENRVHELPPGNPGSLISLKDPV